MNLNFRLAVGCAYCPDTSQRPALTSKLARSYAASRPRQSFFPTRLRLEGNKVTSRSLNLTAVLARAALSSGRGPRSSQNGLKPYRERCTSAEGSLGPPAAGAAVLDPASRNCSGSTAACKIARAAPGRYAYTVPRIARSRQTKADRRFFEPRRLGYLLCRDRRQFAPQSWQRGESRSRGIPVRIF